MTGLYMVIVFSSAFHPHRSQAAILTLHRHRITTMSIFHNTLDDKLLPGILMCQRFHLIE